LAFKITHKILVQHYRPITGHAVKINASTAYKQGLMLSA